MKRARSIAALAMAWLVVQTAAARAEVTAALLVSGGGARAQKVRSAAAGELARVGWKVPELASSATEALRRCLRAEPAWPCLEPRLVERGLTRVIEIQLAAEADGESGEALQLIGQLGSVDSRSIAAQSRYCRSCDDAQLREAARLLVRRLVAAAAVRDDATRIEVRTKPAGAVLRLDGRLVEAPGGAIACSPGLHTVHVQRSGYRSELRAVLVEEGRAATVEITLLPESLGAAQGGGPAATVERIELEGEGDREGRGSGTPAATGDEAAAPPARRTDEMAAPKTAAPKTRKTPEQRATASRPGGLSSSKLGWALVLGGGALLAGGAALVWLDEDARDDASVVHSPRYLDSAPAGAALLAAGGVASLAGAYFFLAPAASAPPPLSAAPSLGSPRSLLLGLRGAF